MSKPSSSKDIKDRVSISNDIPPPQRKTETNLYRKIPHRNQQHQPRKNLLIPPPCSQTASLPPIHRRTSTRALIPIKGPRHILHRAEPTALMRVLDPPDSVPIMTSPQS